MKKINNYEKLIVEEANIWSEGAKELVRKYGGAPEWSQLKNILYNKVYRGEFFEKQLDLIKDGDDVLELGCTTGWFTFEAWRRGANVDALDIADDALDIAKKNYVVLKTKEKRKNKIRFFKQDINFLDKNKNLKEKYDVIIAKGTLHHSAYLDKALDDIKKRMKTGSVLIVEEPNIVFGYQERLNAVFQIFLGEFGTSIFRTVRAVVNVFRAIFIGDFAHKIVHAHGLSPFEGVSEPELIHDLLKQKYKQKFRESYAAFMGNIVAPIENYPENLKNKLLPFLLWLNRIDKQLIKLGVAKGTNFWGVYQKK